LLIGGKKHPRKGYKSFETQEKTVRGTIRKKQNEMAYEGGRDGHGGKLEGGGRHRGGEGGPKLFRQN